MDDLAASKEEEGGQGGDAILFCEILVGVVVNLDKGEETRAGDLLGEGCVEGRNLLAGRAPVGPDWKKRLVSDKMT